MQEKLSKNFSENNVNKFLTVSQNLNLSWVNFFNFLLIIAFDVHFLGAGVNEKALQGITPLDSIISLKAPETSIQTHFRET